MQINNEFLKRLEQIVGEVGGNSNAATFANVSMPTIRRWLDGTAEPRISGVAKLAKSANVSLDWLYFGNKDGEATSAFKTDKSFSEFELIKGYNIQASAGFGSLPGDETPTRFLAFRKKWLDYKNLNPQKLVIIFVKGDSMYPTIHDRDTILINTAQKSLIDGYIYVLRKSDDLLVKRIQTLPNGVRLISDNKFYDNVDIVGNELEYFEIIGQVVHVSHDL